MEGFDWSCEQASETHRSENDWYLRGEVKKCKRRKRGECSERNDISKQKEEEGCMVRKIMKDWGVERRKLKGGKKEGGMNLWKGQFLLGSYHGHGHGHVWKWTWWRALCLVSCAGDYTVSPCHQHLRFLNFKLSVSCWGARGLNQQCKGSASNSYLSPYATSSTAFGSSSGSSSHHSGQSGASSGQTASYASYGAGYNCTASTATSFAAGSQAFPSQQVCMLWHVMLQCSCCSDLSIKPFEILVGCHWICIIGFIDKTLLWMCVCMHVFVYTCNFIITAWSE